MTVKHCQIRIRIGMELLEDTYTAYREQCSKSCQLLDNWSLGSRNIQRKIRGFVDKTHNVIVLTPEPAYVISKNVARGLGKA